MAWLSGFGYRKSHVISQTAGAGADYQVGIKVYYGSGTDGTEVVNNVTMGKVYCSEHCQIDFDDIRFTENDEVTELKYWMETKVNSDYAIFWVKLTDNLTDGDVTIYIYYGNVGVSTTSNGDDTFVFFDDFNDGSINPAKWNTGIGGGYVYENSGMFPLNLVNGDTGITVSEVANAGYLTIAGTCAVDTGTEDGVLSGSLGKCLRSVPTINLANGILIESRVNVASFALAGTNDYFGFGTATAKDKDNRFDSHRYKLGSAYPPVDRLTCYREEAGARTQVNLDTTMAALATGFYRHRYTKTSGNVFGFFENSPADGGTQTSTFNDASAVIGLFAFGRRINCQFNFRWDWIYARKWFGTEPAHSDWGSEEEYGLLLSISSSPINGITFTVSVDGGEPVEHTTPWSGNVTENGEIEVVVTESEPFTSGGHKYWWEKWSDEETSKTRNFIMTEPKSFTMIWYQGKLLTVSLQSITGIASVTIEVDSVGKTISNGSPFTDEYALNASVYLEFTNGEPIIPNDYDTGWKNYYFNHWGDSDTSKTKTVIMNGDKTFEVQLKEKYVTPYSGSVLMDKTMRATMPETHEDKMWSHWQEDNSTNRVKDSLITEDTIITAIFTDELTAIINSYSEEMLGDESFMFIATPSGGSSPYTVQWIKQSDMSVLGSGLTYNFIASEWGIGTHRFFARVTDNYGYMGDSLLVTTVVYLVPSIEIDSYSEKLLITETHIFTAIYEGGIPPTIIIWYNGNDEEIGTGNTYEFDASEWGIGTHHIYAKIIDGEENTDDSPLVTIVVTEEAVTGGGIPIKITKEEHVIKYRRLIAEVLQIECPLFAPIKYETHIDVPLGIVIVDNPVTIEVPLGIDRKHSVEIDCLLLSLRFASLDLHIPLSIHHSSFIDVEIPIGKTIERSKRKLRKIKDILDSLDDV